MRIHFSSCNNVGTYILPIDYKLAGKITNYD